MLVARPEMTESISELLAKRAIELEAVVEGLERGGARPEDQDTLVLNTIREFFGLGVP